MQRAPAFSVVAALACATACAASIAQDSGSASAAGAAPVVSASGAGQPVQPYSLVVVPASISMSTDFSKGCWVRLYDGKNFRGQELMLVGPLRLAGMGTTSPWWRRWNSAVVGPNARLTIYAAGNHQGRSATLIARQRAADLANKEVGWSGKIESAELVCSAS